MIGIVAAMIAMLALTIFVVVLTLVAWANARSAGCPVHVGDIVTAYYRFRNGPAIVNARTKLWTNGIRMSFHEVERLAKTRKELDQRLIEVLAKQRDSDQVSEGRAENS